MATRRDVLIAGAVACASVAPRAYARSGPRPLLASVITCPRPHGVSYLAGTLAAVDAELSCKKLLICDGDASPAPPGWDVEALGPRVRQAGVLPDNKEPGWVAIRAALAQGADLLFFEDDIRPLRRGVFAAMAGHEVPSGAAFTSFFSRRRALGIHAVGDFQLSQALKIPNRSLRVLADAEKTDQLQWSMVVGVDIAIAAFGQMARWRFEQAPNFIEHIGLWSAANPMRKETTQ